MEPIKPFSIAVIGFGSQAKVWSQNLKDSNHKVTVFLRQDSTSVQAVESMGFTLKQLSEFDEASHLFDFTLLLTPDHTHFEIINTHFPKDMASRVVIGHGYSYWKHNFSKEFPKLNFDLLAPKSIASELRTFYLEKREIYGACSDVGCLKLDTLAKGIGITKKILSNFEEEAVADLFSEQALLCGLIPYAANKSFETLVKNGVNPKIAYVECWHEVKLIADAMLAVGPEGLFDMISPNALLGAESFKNQHLNEDLDKIYDQTYHSIKNRDFIEYESQNDISVIRAKVLKFWKNSQIQKVYDDLKK